MKRIGILRYGARMCVAAVIAVIAMAAAAMAYFAAGGTGTASASVGALGAPTISTASPGAGTVALNWSAVTPPSSGTVKYYVTRNGGAPAGNCPSQLSPSTATSCTDSGLGKSTNTYTITAVWQSWSAASKPSSVSVAYGAATALVFSTQPGGGATGGLAFPSQPVVTAQDSNGNVVANYSGTVSLSIASGTSGAKLTSCSGTPSNGVTTFSGCTIDKTGTYTLGASDGTLNATSASFPVTVGPAAKLTFTTQPGGGATGGTAFPSQPALTAQDAGGNTVTTYAKTITLSIASGTTGANLTGCSATPSNGVTTFSGCTIDKTGTYTLTASDGLLTATSNSFTVSAGAAVKLVFSTQPGGGATGGVAFPSQPVVTAVDAGGNTAASYTKSVSMSIATGTSGAALTTCGPVTANSGVATFSGCTIDKAGTYTLTASDSSLSATSNSFSVSAGPAAKLVFSTQPGGGATPGVAFPTQPMVTALDAGGNTAASYSKSVSMSIATGTAGAALSACGPVTAQGGVATFSNCSINVGGTYTLKATDGSLTVTSNSFNVTGATLSLLEQDTPTTQSNTFTTPGNITTTNGGNYLLVISCYGSPSCNSGQTDPTVTGPFVNSGSPVPPSALTVATTDAPSGGNFKSCIEVVQVAGNGASGPITVALGSGENVAFVDVLQILNGKVQGTPNANSAGSTTASLTATAGFTTAPPTTNAELAIVGLTGNTGSDTISAPAGFTGLGTYQHSTAIGGGTPAPGGDLGLYFNPTAQLSSNFALNPLAVNWGTIAVQIG